MHYLYKITDTLNGKCYIGQAVDPQRRWSDHKWNAKQSEPVQYIHRAMAKYGIEYFIFEIIATSRNREDANEIEQMLIAQYNSRNKECGYNIKPGGNTSGHAEETKQKIGEALLNRIATQGHPAQGTKRTPEQLVNLSAALKARDKEAMYTPEVRKQMSEAHIGHKATEEAKHNLSVAITASWAERNEERYADEDYRCHAPNCEVSGQHHYIILDGIRYCSLHGQRLRNTGSLELIPENKTPWNKGKPMPDETKTKLGNSLKGKIPHNKMSFTIDQINKIMTDNRSLTKIAKDYGVSRKVITRIKSGK